MIKKHIFFTWVILASVSLQGFKVQSREPKYFKVEKLFANLTIYWIDTEGGAATLIVTPAGESVLIDTEGDNPRHRVNSIIEAKI